MKVLIIGAGAVGIGIGASLYKGGMEVDFLTHGKNAAYQAILTKGIRRTGIFETIEVRPGEVGVFDTFEKLPDQAYDYILIACRTSQNEEVCARLDAVRRCRKKDAPIVFLQDGISVDTAFLPCFTEKHLYHSRMLTSFHLNGLRESEVVWQKDDILLGSRYRNLLGRISPLADALCESGMATSLDTDIEPAIWTKLIYRTAFSPLGAVLQKPYEKLISSEYSRNILEILIAEAFGIMQAVGKRCEYETAEEFEHFLYQDMLPVLKEERSDMLCDLSKGRRTEIEELTGELLNLAGKYGADCPVSTLIYWQLKALEEENNE